MSISTTSFTTLFEQKNQIHKNQISRVLSETKHAKRNSIKRSMEKDEGVSTCRDRRGVPVEASRS